MMLFGDLDAEQTDQQGGWANGFANMAHWTPDKPRTWRCWAQTGPTWSAHCGVEVDAADRLGLCERHYNQIVGTTERSAA